MRKQTFTLIELLVVIAIIAILASILLPALNKARERAKSIACCNKLRQMNNAIISYVDDNDGWLPNNRSSGDYWIKRIGVYIGSSVWNWGWKANTSRAVIATFKCLSGKEEVKWGINYGYNKTIGNIGAVGNYLGPIKLVKVRNATKKLIITDAACKSSLEFSLDYAPNFVDYRHNNGANILWGDGHIKWLPRNKIFNLPLSSWRIHK